MTDTDRIAESELAWLQRLDARRRQAEQAQADYLEFLAGRHGLAETDRIREDGTILRADGGAG